MPTFSSWRRRWPTSARIRRPSRRSRNPGDALSLRLSPTTDILAATADSCNANLIRIGFAAESQDLLHNAQDKLERKRLDLIVGNDITRSDSGFGSDTTKVVLLIPTGPSVTSPFPKREVAHEILNEAIRLRAERATGTG